MNLALIPCNERQKWDMFVKESPQGTIFCTSAFLEACGERYQLQFVTCDDEPLLGVVLFLDTEGQPLPSPRPFAMYQGVLLAKSLNDAHPHSRIAKVLQLTEFLLSELEKSYQKISLSLHHSFPDVRSFSWFHYHEQEKGLFSLSVFYTGLIDLKQIQTMENLLGNIRTTRRQEARKAEERGWAVETSTDIDLLDRLHELTFDRQDTKRPEGSEIRVRSIANAALDQGFGEILVAKNPEGSIASAILVLFDAHSAYYLIGANDPAFRKDACGSLLLTEGIMRSKKRGCSFFDMVGINSPARGDYKTSFNAVPVPYYMTNWERL